jgi:hypothetical protein
MKLLLCQKCGDVFKLGQVERHCLCGKTRGSYLADGLHATYHGNFAVPLGFANSSFRAAIENQPESGMGRVFEAFVIPHQCDTMVRRSGSV